MSKTFSEFLHFVSWKEFSSYLFFIAKIPEQQFYQELPEIGTLAGGIVQLEGMTQFISQCLLGERLDGRTDTTEFDARQWASVTELDTKQTLLDFLELAYEELQAAILKSTDQQLGKKCRPMEQPGGMSSPAEAVLRLAFICTYQRGQLSCLLKEYL